MPLPSPTSGWCAEVHIGMTSVDYGRHGFYLDKLVCVAQHNDSHERARYIVLAEHLPRSHGISECPERPSIDGRAPLVSCRIRKRLTLDSAKWRSQNAATKR
jgi:hypothetical protein